MVNIPEKNYAIQQTEVTQTLYSKIMGELPTFFNEQGGNHPVVAVSLYDMVYFCNLLSTYVGLTPVYSVGGNTDVKTWNYTPHKGNAIKEEITLNEQASGYRLPQKKNGFGLILPHPMTLDFAYFDLQNSKYMLYFKSSNYF